MGSSESSEALSKQFLDVARASFAWLPNELGMRETKALVSSAAFQLFFDGPAGQVVLAGDLREREFSVDLAPPGSTSWNGEVSMQALLEVHGLPSAPGRIDGRYVSATIETIDANSQALRLLRDLELAGDWSKLKLARARRVPPPWSEAEPRVDPSPPRKPNDPRT